jgi:hypothetical protein
MELESSIAAAQKVLDDFMAAFNARDIPAFEATFNFPSVRLASNTLVILNKGDMKPERFTTGALAAWDHSAWERRDVIHAGADKVHIDTRFTRYRKDGSVIGGFDSIYVITCENGHWGVKARSSYAPQSLSLGVNLLSPAHGVDDAPGAAVLARIADRHGGVEKRQRPQDETGMKENDRGPAGDRKDVEDQVEQRGNRFSREQQGQRRAEQGQEVNHYR